jgi:hypothetical protein
MSAPPKRLKTLFQASTGDETSLKLRAEWCSASPACALMSCIFVQDRAESFTMSSIVICQLHETKVVIGSGRKLPLAMQLPSQG